MYTPYYGMHFSWRSACISRVSKQDISLSFRWWSKLWEILQQIWRLFLLISFKLDVQVDAFKLYTMHICCKHLPVFSLSLKYVSQIISFLLIFHILVCKIYFKTFKIHNCMSSNNPIKTFLISNTYSLTLFLKKYHNESLIKFVV